MKPKYIPSKELIQVAEVAIFLNRPLLLSGEAGTGKTKFADFWADPANDIDGLNLSRPELSLFQFNTKSTSISRDLFYQYDALAHFADKERSAIEFIELNALGKAIAKAVGTEKIKDLLLQDKNNNNPQVLKLRAQYAADREQANEAINRFLGVNDAGRNTEGSLVLIDEVDKAPRDFPNDILNEIENFEFHIKELNLPISLRGESDGKKKKVFVVLTSNFEKNLPEAFLRRCVYFHIPFPDRDKPEDKAYLKEIVKAHVPQIDDQHLNNRLQDFIGVRKNPSVSKKPATSELIDWIKLLCHHQKTDVSLNRYGPGLPVLLKRYEDLKIYQDLLPTT